MYKKHKCIILEKCHGILPGKNIKYFEKEFVYNKGDIVEAEYRNNNWYHIYNGDKFAMLHKKYIEIKDE